MMVGLWSEAIEPKANRRLLPPAPFPRKGVWGKGNVSRRSPFTQSTKKPSQRKAGRIFVRVEGLEPSRLSAPDPKSGLSTIPTHPHWEARSRANPLKGLQRYSIFSICVRSFRSTFRCLLLATHSRPHPGRRPPRRRQKRCSPSCPPRTTRPRAAGTQC